LGVIYLFMNGASELSMAEMTLQATTLQEARDTFCAALYPALDFLSFKHDVPILVGTMRFHDVQNAITHMGYLAPYGHKKLGNADYLFRAEIKTVYALWREAKASSSSPYKLLNYFKILEGLLGPERAKIRQEALAKGVKLTERPDVVPPHDDYPAESLTRIGIARTGSAWNSSWIGEQLAMAARRKSAGKADFLSLRFHSGSASEAKAYIGRSITKFRDDVLEKKYRDVVAHFVLSKKGLPPLDLSVPFEVWRLEDMVLPAELCARVVIETHLIWAEQLK
jgi:hypothetical protein